MGRRLLSHLLISLAVFSLTATFFIWVIDATVLHPPSLNKALQSGGVPSALATLIPEKATQDQKDAKPEEIADMKAKIASVVTSGYVSQKIEGLTTSVIGFMKNGTPQPTLSLSDFPEKLRAGGVDVDDEMTREFSKPIELNKDGALNSLPDSYRTFKLVKYAGAILFVLLLVAEWFVAAKGDKLHRIGRIFLHAGIWYSIWWVALVLVPMKAIPSLKEKVGAGASENVLIDAVIRSIQHLFGTYLLGFAIVCWVLALALYLTRHSRKHVQAIQAVPAAKGAARAGANKR